MNAPKLVTVKVAVDNHTHAGKAVAKGELLTVDNTTASWLASNRIATPVAADTDAAPKKEAK